MNCMNFGAAVESELRGALSRPEPEALRSAARHLCFSSAAKRARPLLVERFGALLQARPERLVPIAVAAELIHSASLLHDDVIDRASERRGQPSANAIYGNRVAVLAGDLLIAVALDLLQALPAGVTAAAVETLAAMTRAALWEIEGARDITLDAARWRQIAAGKTGSLLSFCGRAVALEAADEDAAAAFAAAAEHLGIAFQAADDLADLKPDTGKPRFQDLRHGHPSLLTALAIAADPDLAADLRLAWQEADERGLPEPLAAALADRVVRGPAPERVRASIADDVTCAIALLGPWLGGEAGAELLAWGRALLDDDFFRTLPHAATNTAPKAAP